MKVERKKPPRTPRRPTSNQINFFMIQPPRTPRPIERTKRHQKPAVEPIQPKTVKTKSNTSEVMKPAIIATTQGNHLCPTIPIMGPVRIKMIAKIHLEAVMKSLMLERSKAGQPAAWETVTSIVQESVVESTERILAVPCSVLALSQTIVETKELVLFAFERHLTSDS